MSQERASRIDLSSYIIALLAIFALNFILPRMIPGDPLHAIYGDAALVAMTPEMEAELIKKFALDQSWVDQLLAYVFGLLHGDLGFSYYYRDQISVVIMGALPWTLLLVSLTLVISTSLGMILGIESGSRRGEPLDRGITAGLMFLNGFPVFFMGILLLLIFGVSLGIAPLSGAVTPYAGFKGLDYHSDVLRHLALPLASLVLVQLGELYLLTRNTIVSLLGEPFILTARAKGCSELAVKYAHAGRNSLLPVITAAGLLIPHLFIRTIFIEIVFSYPGMGSLLHTALNARDYPLLQGILLMIAVLVLTVNLLVDLLYKRLDPRVRYAH
jgi:peptide/nickel transport system permease protein